MQYESKTFYLQQNIIINNWNLQNKTLTHAIVYGLITIKNIKIWLLKIIKLFDASSLVGVVATTFSK